MSVQLAEAVPANCKKTKKNTEREHIIRNKWNMYVMLYHTQKRLPCAPGKSCTELGLSAAVFAPSYIHTIDVLLAEICYRNKIRACMPQVVNIA